MTARFFDQRTSFLLLISVCVLLLLGTSLSFQNSRAQTTKLTLVSEETSTRAIVVESITQKHEPFALTSPISWGSDNRTRIMLFAMGLSLESNETPAAITASAEDGAHRFGARRAAG